MFTYIPKGTCSKRIDIETDGDRITSVAFSNGCEGNLTGMSRLLAGMPIRDAIQRMEGIQCQNGTSCPDQLAQALRALQAQRDAAQGDPA